MTESDQGLEQDNLENARAGVTLTKYRNQISWRRNKVRELLCARLPPV